MSALIRALMTDLPILYSFRRCPYAVRARMALLKSGTAVEIREIILRDKPPEMLSVSPKATVPVLLLPDGRLMDESLDIMDWALAQNDPDGWRATEDRALIETNDGPFKRALDRYKYPHRFEGVDPIVERAIGLEWLSTLEALLANQAWLSGQKCTLTDIAIFPFIRQFAATDNAWFDAQPLPNLKDWLERLITSADFQAVMTRYPAWQAGDAPTLFHQDQFFRH